MYFADDKVCFDVKISTIQYGFEFRSMYNRSDAIWWRLGTCEKVGDPYEQYKNYIQRCCLKPQQHILTCINKKHPYGWGDGYIEIQGHRYCDDFMSYKLMQKVTIKGKYNDVKSLKKNNVTMK